MKIRTAKLFLFACACALSLASVARFASASDPGGGDWTMWGGTADRNMVSNQKGMPTSWDVKTNKNVKWVSKLVGIPFWFETILRRSEEHTSELQSPDHLVSHLLLEKT